MDNRTRALMMGAAGAGSAEKIYVEDVFSTWLYTGNGSTQTITNGIDLSGKGGLIWIKRRVDEWDHRLYDTNRGPGIYLASNQIDGQTGQSFYGVTNFGTTGFTIGGGFEAQFNENNKTYASWTFRKAAKFFDVVTYTGNGSNRTIAHNLGSVPGCIIVKRTDTAADWQVYHRSLANTEYLVLNSAAAKATGTTRWNSTTPTSTEFSLGTDATVNASGGTYVAYLFAHDAGGFGDSGNESVVSCGSFTTDASGNATVTLGWEPQWMLIKRSDGLNSWWLCDAMRGLSQTSFSYLAAEITTQEQTYGAGAIKLNPTGCSLSGFWPANASHIYMAIRRGPMKTPTDATKVFQAKVYTGDNTDNRLVATDIVTDMAWVRQRDDGTLTGMVVGDRLRGQPYLLTGTTAIEVDDADSFDKEIVSATEYGSAFTSMTGFWVGNDPTSKLNINTTSNNHVAYAFRRAPGFFDVVAYTGNFTANRQINHSLAVKPQLIIVKARNSGSYGWGVYAEPITATKNLILNTDAGAVTSSNLWNNTEPTATVFTVDGPGGNNLVNGGWSYIAYLFASCLGVSKVGSYTGTGTTLSVDCGFTAGARFVLIKRTDSSGDWFVWDAARGIVSGNDPFLLLNSTAAEDTSTDYIDPLSSGFQISSTAPAAINANGGSYIYLAIA